MEADLKISKVEYLSNHWLDLPQILNLSSGDQTKSKHELIKMFSNGRRPLMEDDLQWKTTSKYQKFNISETTDQIFLKF
jgi:hypothetical protein